MKQFVDVAQDRHSSASEYVREQLRADARRKAEQELEAELLEGMRSTESELTAANWRALRQEALALVRAHSKKLR